MVLLTYRTGRTVVLLSIFCWCLVLGSVSTSAGASYTQARELFFRGEYEKCEEIAEQAVADGVWLEKWPRLLIECQMVTGQYEKARRTLEQAQQRFSTSLPLRALGHDVYHWNNQPEEAQRQHDELFRLVQKSPWKYSSPIDRVTLGRFFVRQREDARQILELFYDRALKASPQLVEAHLAIGELALTKHDYQEAVKALEEAASIQPGNPDIHYRLSRAWRSSNSQKANEYAQQALALNPRHVPTLLDHVDHLIDAEEYSAAQQTLAEVLQINLRNAKAWAYHAVIAHLNGAWQGEQLLRQAAFEHFSSNATIDHLIGKKLSDHYRFREGAEYQRKALQSDPNLIEAKFQLSQDLLRIGKDLEGWRLAREVHEEDGYNVVAYNLVNLSDRLEQFETLKADHLIVRMDANEAKIYGDAVLELLQQAKQELCEKYKVTLQQPTTVEIFPRQSDFAIRTFGLPGGAGYLGVCFGPIITANSPASQGERPANWKSVLWHEFCHVITLEKTSNRIPRWLSEGISVYEEQLRNESWGERLTPAYRQMILQGELVPISKLSSAFLRPASPLHLQFAYYQSALAVRYLVDQYGLPIIHRVLDDLGAGLNINESLSRYVGSMKALDDEFAEYAMAEAASVDLRWDKTKRTGDDAGQSEELQVRHSNSYPALMQAAKEAIAADEMAEALEHLAYVRKRYPDDRSLDGCLALMAKVYQGQGDQDRELETLERLAALNDRALEVYFRLAQIYEEREQYEDLLTQSDKILAVNPLIAIGHELKLRSAHSLGRRPPQIEALNALLYLDPVDPSSLHFQLAELYEAEDQPAKAKRQVLMALEYAPRFRKAQTLLLRLVEAADELDSVPVGDGVDSYEL